MPNQDLVWNTEWPEPAAGYAVGYTAEESARYRRMAEDLGWGPNYIPRTGLSPQEVLIQFGTFYESMVAGIEERAEAAAITFEESDNGQFNRINEWLLREAPFLDNGWSKPYVNEYAFSFRHDHGHWPVLGDLVGNADFVMGALKLPTYASLLPDTFIVMSDTGPVLYDNRPITGPVPVEMPLPPEWSPSWDDPQQGAVGFVPRPPELPKDIPIISPADLDQTMAEYSRLLSQATYSGGQGRTTPVYDRTLLEENIRTQWKAVLLEEPPNLGSLVDAYISEATSFYMTSGGQTNWQAWLLKRMRQTPRYGLLYAQKPSGVDETEYLGRYQNVVKQFGFRSGMELAETEKGMTTGVDLTSLGERLSRTPEYMGAHKGDLSQMFAATFKNLGASRGS